ncbi:MAG: hypothetical protein ABSH32_33315 [Bryobacteraceae bacterium]|jgi:hypothetical protein
MTGGHPWGWLVLFLLGAYHGINPGMGWLFAVALGMQESSARAVVRSLAPIACGHAIAIGVVILLARLVQIVLPLSYVKIAVASSLLAMGVYRLVRSRHFAWGGMQVGFRELMTWSFLMASAHGAGLMVLPVVMGLGSVQASAGQHSMHVHSYQDPLTGIWATLVHTAGYLTFTAAVALVVYQKLGLALLRRAWFNLDLVWAIALIATGVLAAVIS